MDTTKVQVEIRLEVWADFARGGLSAGLGYPPMSAEQQAGYGRGAASPIDWPDDVMRIDRAVLALPSPEHIKLIRLRYLGRQSTRGIARLMRCDQRTVCARLGAAHAFIDGWLCAKTA